MDTAFGVLALLPLALASFLSRGRQGDAGFGFLAALAPVLASGIGSLIKHKQASSAEKKQAEYEKQLAAQEEQKRQTEFEASQNSPAALAQRQKFTLQLGKLLGAAGGKEKIPPSIYNYLSGQRQAQAYTPGGGYTPKPSSGSGIWDVLGGATEALSYLDTSRLKPKATSVGQPTGLSGAQFKTGQVNDLQREIMNQRKGTPVGPLATTDLKRTSFYS